MLPRHRILPFWPKYRNQKGIRSYSNFHCPLSHSLFPTARAQACGVRVALQIERSAIRASSTLRLVVVVQVYDVEREVKWFTN